MGYGCALFTVKVNLSDGPSLGASHEETVREQERMRETEKKREN